MIIRTMSHNTFIYHNISWNNRCHYGNTEVWNFLHYDHKKYKIILKLSSPCLSAPSQPACFQIRKLFYKQINNILITRSEWIPDWLQKIINFIAKLHCLSRDFCFIFIIFHINFMSVFYACVVNILFLPTNFFGFLFFLKNAEYMVGHV